MAEIAQHYRASSSYRHRKCQFLGSPFLHLLGSIQFNGFSTADIDGNAAAKAETAGLASSLF
jgi:hypothetical protein